ncbi:MAG: hypothetical protein OK422_05180 [Thaumarchaeota archaeon]|nr:hypothetical protein [Nitrososphaerota archaeon]
MKEQEEGETYLYGLASPSIRNRRADVRGCGVYATNKRVFLVRAPPRVQAMFLLPWCIAIVLLASGVGLLLSLLSTGNSVYSWLGPQLYLYWTGFAFLFVALASSWYRDFAQVPIQELERRRIYQVEREQILEVEMRRRTFWSSQIVVRLRGGEKRLILFAEPGSFDRARRAFQMFSPTLCP